MACSIYKGFRRPQNIIDYEASLAGLNVKYVDARNTSSLCPICGMSPNGHRLMRCQGCGLEEDGAWWRCGDLLRRCQMDAGASPENLPWHGKGRPSYGS
jgi:hypothetical protein